MQVCVEFERGIGHTDAEKDAEYLEIFEPGLKEVNMATSKFCQAFQ